jgi:hypothetical protein
VNFPSLKQGDNFLFLTIFILIHTQIKNASTGAIYNWLGFRMFFKKKAVTYNSNPETEDETALKASAYIKSKQSVFTFVHFDLVDHVKYEYGHGSLEYYKAVFENENLLNKVNLDAVFYGKRAV